MNKVCKSIVSCKPLEYVDLIRALVSAYYTGDMFLSFMLVRLDSTQAYGEKYHKDYSVPF